jgi:L-threonylcarbamoyladenylate synthase
LLIRAWQNDEDLKQQLGNGNYKERIHIIAHTHIPSGKNFPNISVIPHDYVAFARAIYAELHRCDQAGAELIVIEQIPPTPDWQGIADRLKRAAAK